MEEHGTTGEPGGKSPPRVARNLGRIAVALFVVAVTVAFVLFATLILTFFYWKGAIAFNVLVVGLGVLLWKTGGFGVFWRFVVVAATVASVASSVLFFRAPWMAQARHDARLAEMMATLCAVDVPAGATIHDCGGSITNTGNGNSCRYLATAVVRGAADPATVVDALEAQGFSSTRLDSWGDPMDDGRTYVLPVQSDGLRLAMQASWQPQEDDLRCT